MQSIVYHAYPREFVSFIYQQWEEPHFRQRLAAAGIDGMAQLPDPPVLEQVISTCYQASLMREEERPVSLRLILRDQSLFSPDDGPPTGLHRLQFATPRPFNHHELRRLAPAADYDRALIGITESDEKGLQIWGIVYSGTRWLQPITGGTKPIAPLPSSLVVYVTGPGRITVSIGSEMIASLNGGQISPQPLDVFSATWFTEIFAPFSAEIEALHEAARLKSKTPWAKLDPDFGGILGPQVARRIVSLICNSHHGGMLVCLPTEMSEVVSGVNKHISLKYQFLEEEPRRRFRTLLRTIMDTFAELHGESGKPEKVAGWQDYVNSKSDRMMHLDEAFFDLAHFIAALSAVDGAVVITKHLDILGFGGVISGSSEEIDGTHSITHALDIEGRHTRLELIDQVGTRHRAAYRLCREIHDAFAVVISQDGNVRLVKWHNGAVTYWDLASSAVSAL